MKMPDYMESLCQKNLTPEGTVGRTVLAPSTSTIIPTTNISQSHLEECSSDTVTYGHLDSASRQAENCVDMRHSAQSSNRVVLPLVKTSLDSCTVSKRIVLPPQREVISIQPAKMLSTQLAQTEDMNVFKDGSHHKSNYNLTSHPDTTHLEPNHSKQKLLIPRKMESAAATKLSSQYLDYIEEMELKIRYMKNDIEFKQSQITARNSVSTNKSTSNSFKVKKIINNSQFKSNVMEKASESKQTLPIQFKSFNINKSTTSLDSSKAHLMPEPRHDVLSSLKYVSNSPVSISVSHNQGKVTSTECHSLTSSYEAAPCHSINVSSHLPIQEQAEKPQPVFVSLDKRKVIFSTSDSQNNTGLVSAGKALFQQQIPNNFLNHPVVSTSNSVDLSVKNFGNKFKLVKTVSSHKIIATPKLSDVKKYPECTADNSTKIISKYKLKRLPAGSFLKQPASLNSSIKSRKNRSCSYSDTPTPSSSDKKYNFLRKTPKLNIQSAARLVSKYKLKRLSPTSSLRKGPLFHSHPASLMKLDKRIESNPHTHLLHTLKFTASKSQSSSVFNPFVFHSAFANNQFNWSRPNLQAIYLRKLKIRQKFRLGFASAHRYTRYQIDKNLWQNARIKKKPRKTSNVIQIGDHMYKTNKRQLTRIKKSPIAQKSQGWRKHKMKLISLQGVHFHSDSRGKKLSRASYEHSSKELNLGDKKAYNADVGLLQKRPDENARLAASRAVYRSIAVVTAKYRKNNLKQKLQKQHCIFYGRFGKCFRGDKCPYVHDPQKVAVCRRFLRGQCDTTNCPFSHKASVNKMPVCLFYLRGLCYREECSYLHVKVSPVAPVCKDFLNGFCSLGDKCKKLHSLVCPTFSYTGQCHRGVDCPLLHRCKTKEQSASIKSSLISRIAVKKDVGSALVKANRDMSTHSCSVTSQPSFISLNTADMCKVGVTSNMLPAKSSSKTPLTQLLSMSKRSKDKPTPSDATSRIRPSFLLAVDSSQHSQSVVSDSIKPMDDLGEPLKITPSFLSRSSKPLSK